MTQKKSVLRKDPAQLKELILDCAKLKGIGKTSLSHDMEVKHRTHTDTVIDVKFVQYLMLGYLQTLAKHAPPPDDCGTHELGFLPTLAKHAPTHDLEIPDEILQLSAEYKYLCEEGVWFCYRNGGK
jgi:hypothetical protein